MTLCAVEVSCEPRGSKRQPGAHMRFAAFLVGLFAVLLLMAVGYWVFLTVQFPAGPINVLMDYSGQRWLVQAVLAAIVFTLVITIVATLMSWRPRVARAVFLISAASWAIIAVVDTVGVVVKWSDEGTAPAGSGPLSAVLNVLLVVSPLLPLLVASFLAGRARRHVEE